MLIKLINKRALVCGSSQGIGLAIAQQLAQSGAEVVLMARNSDRLKSIITGLPGHYNQQHRILVADFSNPSTILDALASLPEDYLIDILINNTGGPAAGKAIDSKPEDYLNAFQQHLIANQLLVQHVVPGMKKNNYGRIINIISTSVKQPLKNLGVSNTIRGAVANWSKTLAGELGPFGITVNNLLPGATETERLTNIIKNRSGQTGESAEAVTTDMLLEIPAGRFGKPEELAYAAAFLASEYASYINGINLPVDGGRTLSL